MQKRRRRDRRQHQAELDARCVASMAQVRAELMRDLNRIDADLMRIKAEFGLA